MKKKLSLFQIIFIVGSSSLLMLFQNCGEMKPAQELLQQNNDYELELKTTSALREDPDLVLSSTPQSSQTQSLSLRMSTRYSAVFSLPKNIQDQTLMRIGNPNLSDQDDSIVVQIKENFLIFSQYTVFPAGLELKVPIDRSQAHIIGISFDDSLSSLPLFYLDGLSQHLKWEQKGSKSALAFVVRDLQFSAQLREMIFFSRPLSGLELSSLSRKMGRFWGLAPFPIDLGPQGQPTAPTLSNEFKLASQVIQTRCLNCHDGAHSNWKTWSEKDYLLASTSAGPLVTKKSLDQSQLYQRILTSDLSKKMPKSAAPLTQEETAAIANWILSIP